MDSSKFTCVRTGASEVVILFADMLEAPFRGEELDAVELLTNMGLEYSEVEAVLASAA